MTYAHIAASKGSVSVIKELMKVNREVICKAKNIVSIALLYFVRLVPCSVRLVSGWCHAL